MRKQDPTVDELEFISIGGLAGIDEMEVEFLTFDEKRHKALALTTGNGTSCKYFRYTNSIALESPHF